MRVLREIDGTAGVAHTISETIYENPRKLTFSVGFRSDYDYKVNRELYFNPVEFRILGTTAGLGIGVTLSISNPGTEFLRSLCQQKLYSCHHMDLLLEKH